MRIYERSAGDRELGRLFIPQEPRALIPSDLGEEIILTHPVQPPTSGFLVGMQRDTITGAAAADTVELPVVPEGFYRWVQCCAAFSDTAVFRNLTILIGSAALGFTEIAGTTDVGTNVSLTVPRIFLVPPGLRIRANIENISGAEVLTLRSLFLELLLAENHPGL